MRILQKTAFTTRYFPQLLPINPPFCSKTPRLTHSCHQISDIGLQSIGVAISKPSLLKSLDLNFERYEAYLDNTKHSSSWMKITDHGLKGLCEGFQGAHALQNLSLNLSS